MEQNFKKGRKLCCMSTTLYIYVKGFAGSQTFRKIEKGYLRAWLQTVSNQETLSMASTLLSLQSYIPFQLTRWLWIMFLCSRATRVAHFRASLFRLCSSVVPVSDSNCRLWNTHIHTKAAMNGWISRPNSPTQWLPCYLACWCVLFCSHKILLKGFFSPDFLNETAKGGTFKYWKALLVCELWESKIWAVFIFSKILHCIFQKALL